MTKSLIKTNSLSMSDHSWPKFSLLGQCSFTYMVLENLVKRRLTPGYVLIEKSDDDYDPFSGLIIDNQCWFEEHKLYHRDWLSRIKDLCRQNTIRLEFGFNVIDKIERSDALVVAGYAKKVPSYIFKKYNGWAINIHPSILPMFKGPQPEAQMILCGNNNYAGVTIHEMNDFWDSGQIYWQKKLSLDSSFTIGQMEAMEANLACIGLKELFQKYPVIDCFDLFPVHKQSYQSWYDTSLLTIDKTCLERESCTHLFRLRPEGYAHLFTTKGVFYPIIEFANEENESFIKRVIGGVLKSEQAIKYLCKDDAVEFIKELCQ